MTEHNHKYDRRKTAKVPCASLCCRSAQRRMVEHTSVRESTAYQYMYFQKFTVIHMDIHYIWMSVFHYPFKCRYQRRTLKWISARPYPAGFEMLVRAAIGRAGLPKRYCAGFCPPVSPYPPGFPIPGGHLITRWVSHYPAGQLGTHRAGLEPASPSLLLSRRQMSIRRCGLICLLGNSICKSNSS